ncbi:MAG: hypothetical protein V2A62_02905 [Candidatus Woesearchaeota archaeon]
MKIKMVSMEEATREVIKLLKGQELPFYIAVYGEDGCQYEGTRYERRDETRYRFLERLRPELMMLIEMRTRYGSQTDLVEKEFETDNPIRLVEFRAPELITNAAYFDRSRATPEEIKKLQEGRIRLETADSSPETVADLYLETLWMRDGTRVPYLTAPAIFNPMLENTMDKAYVLFSDRFRHNYSPGLEDDPSIILPRLTGGRKPLNVAVFDPRINHPQRDCCMSALYDLAVMDPFRGKQETDTSN